MEENKNEVLETQQEVVEEPVEEVTEDSYGAVSEELDIPQYEDMEEEKVSKKSALPKILSIVVLVAAILNFVAGAFFTVTDFASTMKDAKPYEEMLKASITTQAEQYGVPVDQLTGGKTLDAFIEEYKKEDNYAKQKLDYEKTQKETVVIPAIKAVVKDTVNVLVYTSVILGIYALLKCFAIYFKDEEDFADMFAFGCDCDDDCECDCDCEE